MGDYLSQKVLIVEDDGTSRKILRGILHNIGFIEIEEVESGEAALTNLQENQIGLVLADWHMAGMSGLELLKLIKTDQRHQRLKVLMVTAESRQANILEAVRAGVDGYIMKPFSKANIQQKIEAIFSHHQPEEQTGPSPSQSESNPTEHLTTASTS